MGEERGGGSVAFHRAEDIKKRKRRGEGGGGVGCEVGNLFMCSRRPSSSTSYSGIYLEVVKHPCE